MTKKQIATATALLISGFMAGKVVDSDEPKNGIEINEQTALEVEVDGVKKYIVDAKLPDAGTMHIVEEISPCVIPDSPDEKEVDCLCDEGTDAGPRWRGVNVCPRKQASGTQCIPSGCRVIFGVRNIR